MSNSNKNIDISELNKSIEDYSHNNWTNNKIMASKVYSEENLQFIYDLGFIGIVINLDKINIRDYKNLKNNLNKIKDSKNGKI